ncbi:hypothetical protein Tco_0164867 [Tanacetum coccineum]
MAGDGLEQSYRSAEKSTVKDRDLTSRTVLFVTCLTDLKKRNDDDVDACWCSFGSEFQVFKVNEMRKERHAPQASMNLIDFQDYSGFNLDHLEDLQMLNFRNLAIEFKHLKFIMAKSLVLNKVRLELNKEVSVDEELKILRDFIRLPFPRASPSAILIIECP